MQNAVVLRCGIAIDALKQRALPLERFFVCVEIRVFRGREWLEGRGDCFRLSAVDHLLVAERLLYSKPAAGSRASIQTSLVSSLNCPRPEEASFY